MGQEPAELTPDASPWHRWGAKLRHSRNDCGLSLDQLGAKIHASRSYLSKLERGTRRPGRQLAVACDQVLGLAGTLVAAWDQAKEESRPAPMTGREPGVHVSSQGVHVSNNFPGLAETALHQEPSDDLGIRVPCRLRDGRMSFVTVPRRAFLRGGATIGAAAALGFGAADATAAARPRTATAYGATPLEHFRTVRSLLIDSDNLLGPQRVIPTVLESIKSIQHLRRDSFGSDRKQLLELQTQFGEFAAWLHQDIGDFRSSEYWLDRALQWSHTVGNDDLTSFVMARKSQLAGEMLDLVDVVDLAEAAQGRARPGSRLAAVGQTYEAFGHALRGDATASERAFDQAREAADALDADPSPWGVWLDVSYVEVHRAQGLEVLGKHKEAAASFAHALSALPSGYHRDRGVYTAREAVAHAGAGAPEHAAAMGLQALAVGEDTGSGRILKELARLDTALESSAGLPAVAQFRTALDEIVLHEA